MRWMAILIPLVAIGALAQEPAATDVPREIAARLEGLRPEQPLDYFLLAEELAYDDPDPAREELVRRLFVLAFELDRRQGGTRLGPAACLALADLSPRVDDRRWLRAVAAALQGEVGAGSVEADEVSETTALALAEALGRFRAGEYRTAQALLERSDVSRLLRRYEEALEKGVDWILLELATEPVCRECGNRRIVTADLDPNQAHRLCYTCEGTPGPDLTDEQLVEQLRLEALLLKGGTNSWSAQALAGGGAPLRDVDPAEIAAWFGVDAMQSIWRDGAWIAPPEPEAADKSEDSVGDS